MRMKTIYLTDAQLHMLATVELARGGVVGQWANDLQAAGIDTHTAEYLVHEGYLEPIVRPAAGGALPRLRVTDKGRRELMIRFIAGE